MLIFKHHTGTSMVQKAGFFAVGRCPLLSLLFFFLHCFQHPPHGLCVHRMMPAGQVRVNSRHSLLLSHISDRLSSIAMRDPEHFLNNICQLSLSTDVMALNRVSLSCMRVQSCLVTTVEHCWSLSAAQPGECVKCCERMRCVYVWEQC